MISMPFQSSFNKAVILLCITLIVITFSCEQVETNKMAQFITALNSHEIPIGDKTYAIVGVSLIDGISDTPLQNASVLVQNGIISEVGEKGSFQTPEDAQIIDGEGMSLLPGLIDAHYHNSKGYPSIYLKKGAFQNVA